MTIFVRVCSLCRPTNLHRKHRSKSGHVSHLKRVDRISAEHPSHHTETEVVSRSAAASLSCGAVADAIDCFSESTAKTFACCGK
jgi:crotonobetainyl-CoA:carnitine CoA-transferase CaiB-like acyl-CoA transferase